jgi:hypothetical protein
VISPFRTVLALAVGLALAAPAPWREGEPGLDAFRPADFFPIDVGNTWIWGGEGIEYSVKSITDSRRTPEGEEHVTFESTTRRGALQFYDDFVLRPDGRLYRKAVRFLAGTSIEYDPPVLYCAFSGTVGETLAEKVRESTGRPDPKEYHRRVTVAERRSVGTVLGSFGDCIIVRMQEFASADAERPEATVDVWFARDVGPIKFRGVDKAGRVTEHQVVYARVGTKRLGLDPREEAN